MNRNILILIGTVLLAGVVAVAVTAAVQSAAQPEAEPELEEFVPSEEIPADSAISFPVDI